MATAQQVEQHARALDDITTVAVAEFAREWRSFDLGDAQATERQAREALADISDAYGYAAAGAAADWYEELRTEARTPGRFRPIVVAGAAAPQVTALAGWGVGPLYGQADSQLALSRMTGGLQRFVADADRTTIMANTRRDPAGVRWYRQASATACAFCAMLASRGAQYHSESSASFKSHNHCGCFAAPIFPGEAVEVPGYYDDFAGAYNQASEAVAAEGGPRSAKPILAKMRELGYR